MARLSGCDLRDFTTALLALNAEDDPASLSRRILTCLRALFDSEFVSFSRMDLEAGRLQTTAFWPSTLTGWPGMATFQRYLPNDPGAAHIMRTGETGALKVSDFVSLRQYRDMPVYTEVFARVGCDRRLGFAIQNDSPSAMIATINRAGKDFSEEDRTRLDLLRPHLLQANAKAHVHGQWRTERERERSDLGEVFGTGLGEINVDGNLLWITPRGRALLADFFPAKDHTSTASGLPLELRAVLQRALRRWAGGMVSEDSLRAGRGVWQFAGPEGRKLNVRLAAGTPTGRWQLLLVEAGVSPGVRTLSDAFRLTGRQREVLHWLTQGKTNGEMGKILAVSEKTVGKHLEHIFAKLGVENRTSAVSLAVEFSAGSPR